MSKNDTSLDFNVKVIKVKYMADEVKNVEIKPVPQVVEACRPSCDKEKKAGAKSGGRINKPKRR